MLSPLHYEKNRIKLSNDPKNTKCYMQPERLNFKHLRYFWAVAKEGSVTRAAARLGMTPQTISGQIALLEGSLGTALFAPQGRGLTLTDSGRAALKYADQIFQLGEELQETLGEARADEKLRFTVGISDALPKHIAYRLLAPALTLQRKVRLVCFDGHFDALLAELALQRLDVVLTDRPASTGGNLRVYSHALGQCSVSIVGSATLASRYAEGFPASLDGAPMLLPTRGNILRSRLDQWFEAHDLRPDIVAEIADSALLKTFGDQGLGLFPILSLSVADLAEQFSVTAIGEIAEVQEQFFAISNERKIRHPALEAMLVGQGVT